MSNVTFRFPTVAALLACATPLATQAQQSDEPEEVVVTAQKREQSVQDVPISITAFSARELRDLGITSTTDLAAITPGLTIGQNTGDGDFPFISLRGVTVRDFADTNESPSAVYMDEFYKANLVGLDQQVFDMQRVEVLRGPQGTLYGRNATGGLVHYLTRQPTDTPEGYAAITLGEFETRRVEAAVGGPLGEAWSARLSLLHDEHEGWMRNLLAGGQDGNALDANSARAQIAFEPSDAARYTLLAQFSENENDAGNMFHEFSARTDPVTGLAVAAPGSPGFSGFVDPSPDEPRTSVSDRDISLKTRQLTAIGRGEWRIGDLQLVSVSGYEKSAKDGSSDSDATPFVRGTEVHPRGEQYSQELRLAGARGRTHWLAGLYYFNYHIDGRQARCLPATCNANRNPIFYDMKTDSWAAFGNVDWTLTDTLSLTTGVRYTRENKDYVLNNTDAGIVFSRATVGELARRDDDDVSFNARLNLSPREDVLLYAGVARGFKAGTFNVGFTPIATAAIPVKPEELTSYEMGFKTSMGRALRLNGAVFYYDYQDSQAFQFDGQTLASTAFNRDATIQGAELEVDMRPLEGFNLRLTGTYLDATLKGVVRPGPTSAGLPPVDTRMPLAPKWNLSGLARYQWHAPWSGNLWLQATATYNSDQYFDAFNSPAHFEPGYTVVNARIGWDSADDKWNVTVFADNVTDRIYRTYSFDLAFLSFATSVYGKPRWIGGTVTYSF
jgi:iron complex outermembrane recepter protein